MLIQWHQSSLSKIFIQDYYYVALCTIHMFNVFDKVNKLIDHTQGWGSHPPVQSEISISQAIVSKSRAILLSYSPESNWFSSFLPIQSTKYHLQNAGNDIHRTVFFNFFWGSMPTDPLQPRTYSTLTLMPVGRLTSPMPVCVCMSPFPAALECACRRALHYLP